MSGTIIVVEGAGNVVNNNAVRSDLISTEERMLHCVCEVKALIDFKNVGDTIRSVICKTCVGRSNVLHWFVGVIEGMDCARSSVENFCYASMASETMYISMTVESKATAIAKFIRGEVTRASLTRS